MKEFNPERDYLITFGPLIFAILLIIGTSIFLNAQEVFLKIQAQEKVQSGYEFTWTACWQTMKILHLAHTTSQK